MYIELSQVQHSAIRQREARRNDPYRDSDEPGEGQPEAAVPAEPITPTMVNLLHVRSITPRKNAEDGSARIGCRIVFRDGRGFAVTDTFGDLLSPAEAAGFLNLTKVVSMRGGRPHDDDDDEEGRVDATDPGVEPTTPVLINPECIRSFNRRKDRNEHEPRIGVRFMFSDGRGFPVRETYDVVKGMVEGRQQG